MPAAYTHITLVKQLSTFQILKKANIQREIIFFILDKSNFCELGAMSPDYPCILGGFSPGDEIWTEKMHYEQAESFVKNAIQEINSIQESNRDILIAWLFGYVSHMVADMVIHAVVESKVGTYDIGSTNHRICELNQDVHIFSSNNLGDTKSCEVLDPIIKECSELHSDKNDGYILSKLKVFGLKGINSKLNNFWTNVLKKTYPEVNSSPSIDNWHISFLQTLDKIVEDNNFPLLTSHYLSQEKGIVHPLENKVDDKYISKLPTPTGWKDYDIIFKKAKKHTLEAWKLISDNIIVSSSDINLSYFKDWDFGTGRYSTTGKYAFWSEEYEKDI